MVNLKTIEDYMSNNEIAVIGASTNKKKYGNIVFNFLLKRQVKVYPVNPHTQEIEGIQCYPDISSLPSSVKAAIFITQPEVTEKITKEICKGNYIEYLWFQPGAESKGAIEIAKKNGIEVVEGECILMYSNPSSFPHNVHKFFKKFLGSFPE